MVRRVSIACKIACCSAVSSSTIVGIVSCDDLEGVRGVVGVEEELEEVLPLVLVLGEERAAEAGVGSAMVAK